MKAENFWQDYVQLNGTGIIAEQQVASCKRAIYMRNTDG